MAKFSGVIGFASTEESEEFPGVHEEVIIEKDYTGDVLRNNRQWNDRSWEDNPKVLPDLTIQNRFSILCDNFAIENTSYMRYITVFGSRWKISSVDIQRPRMILTVSGLYNGPIAEEEEPEEEPEEEENNG